MFRLRDIKKWDSINEMIKSSLLDGRKLSSQNLFLQLSWILAQLIICFLMMDAYDRRISWLFKISHFNTPVSLQDKIDICLRVLWHVRAPSPSLVSEKQKGSHARRESLKCCRRVGSGMEGGLCVWNPFLVCPATGLNRSCGRGPPGLREKSGRPSLEETAFVRLSALF